MALLLSIRAIAIASILVTATAQWRPQVYISIDCGSSTGANDSLNGIHWQGENTTFTKDGYTIATSVQNPDLPSSIPYLSARVFNSSSSYTFTIRGRYWLRLYFYPISVPGLDPSSANFTITAGTHQLFSGSIVKAIKDGNKPHLIREFSVDPDGNTATIGFQPSPGSFAFINGIQIMSSPDDALRNTAVLLPEKILQKFVLETAAFQAMYRLNVGGSAVNAAEDEQGRSWIPDNRFIEGAASGSPTIAYTSNITYPKEVPKYIAPSSVYGTARVLGTGNNNINSNFNISWLLPIDPGFPYLIRLHFAELIYDLSYERIFNIYINNQTALEGFDIRGLNIPKYTPLYRDFMVFVRLGLPSLRLQMGATRNSGSEFNEAILNGVEVFKMNNSNGSLAVPSRVSPDTNGGVTIVTHGRSSISTGIIVGTALGCVVVLGIVLWYLYRRCRRTTPSPLWKPAHSQVGASVVSIGSPRSIGTTSTSAQTAACRHFTLQQIRDATNDFDDELLLGVGGFGKVFKGELEGSLKVAVKRGNPRSEQGLTEFQTEIEMLSRLRHRHLVSLIGYCNDNSEMILVYDYMAKGPLREHLYGTDVAPLSWKRRLEICVGAARGLHYLHTGAARGIIHRNVKTTNILLDDNFVAKVADFGLSKVGPSLEHTHVSTAVKGSFGYLDPEYFRRQHLTEKSDVYSFGVVLMEVLCARPAINPTLPRDQVSIAEWSVHWQKLGMLENIMDPNLVGDCSTESLRQFGGIAESCLSEVGSQRPTMGQVLWNLEYALQLHQASMLGSSTTTISEQTMELMPIRAAASGDSSLGSEVFSQFINPVGR